MDRSDAPDFDTSWSCDTSWCIASGNLQTCVSFESSGGLSCDEDVDKLKSPLILCPTSTNHSPCQVTLRFARKYEVRQVYVRSTARVYEIYYAQENQSDDEYLCTVRCSVASRDGEVLRAGDVEGVVLARDKWSGEDRSEEKKVGDGNNSPSGSEDEWVEVNRTGPFPSKCCLSQGRNLQDLYEATAEMNDTNPCTSLTLRLLSLQDKGCVWVDEVYVFADPVDDCSAETQDGTVGNPSGNSVMAMLLPTFFQLSKTRDVRRTLDTVETTKTQKSREVLSSEAEASIQLNQTNQDGKSDEANRLDKLQDAALPPIEPVQLGNPPTVLDSACKPDVSPSHIESALYYLVSRVNRIEEMFLRFEENMLKPLSSIDERLHRVEQQLELFTRKTQSSEMRSCNRISAPEFSCSESDTNSFYNNGSVHLSSVPCEADKQVFYSGVPSTPDNSAHVTENTMHPSLVVTAPEFSYGNEEELCQEADSDAGSLTDGEEECQRVETESVEESLAGKEEGSQEVESRKELPTDKLKKVVSIDDALASALAGFLTSSSEKSQKCSQYLAVKAPEFPDDEENDGDKATLPRIQSETASEPACLTEPDRIEHKRVVYSSLSLSSSAESEKNAMPSPVNDLFGRKGERYDDQCQNDNTEGGASHDGCIVEGNAVDTNVFGRNDFDEIVNELNDEKQSEKISDISLAKRPGSQEQFCGDQNDIGSDNSKESSVKDEPSSSSGATEQSKEHVLRNVVDFPVLGSVVDFKSPILDVKFFPQESSDAKTPLEALLDGMLDTNPEVPFRDECGSDGDGSSSGSLSQVGEGRNLISVEDWVANGSGTDSHIVVDINYCSLKDITPISESEKLEKHDAEDETPAASSLI